jgi:hypothetical protein
MLQATFAGFIGGSSPAARVEGARRCVHKCSLHSTAGFILRAVKRRQARYKLALHEGVSENYSERSSTGVWVSGTRRRSYTSTSVS